MLTIMQQQQYLYREMYKVLPKNLGPPKNKVSLNFWKLATKAIFYLKLSPPLFRGLYSMF